MPVDKAALVALVGVLPCVWATQLDRRARAAQPRGGAVSIEDFLVAAGANDVGAPTEGLDSGIAVDSRDERGRTAPLIPSGIDNDLFDRD